MKKHVFIMSVLTLFIFNCSVNEDAPKQDPNSINLEKPLETASLKKQVQELLKNEETKNAIISHIEKEKKKITAREGKNQNPDRTRCHGLVVIQNPTTSFFGFFTDENIIFVGHADPESSTITFLRNGEARFNINSKEPSCAIYDLGWNPIYSNDCYDNLPGYLFSNFVAKYEEIDLGEPFGTLYFPSEITSINIFTANTKVNDAVTLYDPDTYEFIGCSDPTVQKNVKITSISNFRNFPPYLSIRIN